MRINPGSKIPFTGRPNGQAEKVLEAVAKMGGEIVKAVSESGIVEQVEQLIRNLPR